MSSVTQPEPAGDRSMPDLDAIGTAAYISDRGWNILLRNGRFDQMFLPGDLPANVMRWTALEPVARIRYCGDWKESWLKPMLVQLREAFERHPEDHTLAALNNDVLQDPVTGPVYRSVPAAHVHPDGHTRPFWHAGLQSWTNLTLCAAVPKRGPGKRLMLLLPQPQSHSPASGGGPDATNSHPSN